VDRLVRLFPASELPNDMAVPTPIRRELNDRGRDDTANADHPEGLGAAESAHFSQPVWRRRYETPGSFEVVSARANLHAVSEVQPLLLCRHHTRPW